MFILGFKTQVSKFGFKTDIENPKIDKLNFWFTLTGPRTRALYQASWSGFFQNVTIKRPGPSQKK